MTVERRLEKIMNTLLSLKDDVNYLDKYKVLFEHGNVNVAAYMMMNLDYSDDLRTFEIDGYKIVDYGDGIHSLKNIKTGVLSLVYADNYRDAINKIEGKVDNYDNPELLEGE